MIAFLKFIFIFMFSSQKLSYRFRFRYKSTSIDSVVQMVDTENQWIGKAALHDRYGRS